MRYAKRFLALLLCALCLLSLSACHGSRGYDDFTMPESFDSSREYEISFWAKNDTNKTQTEIYQKAIRDFEALYPNIRIQLRLYTDYGKIYNDVITNISTGTTPNVCITYPDHIATYMTGTNSVVPLDNVIADAKYGLGGSELRFDGPTREEIIPQFLSECAIGGTTYALPFMRSTEACYINKTMLESLGYEVPDVLTWDFVWDVSEQAMKKNADGTFAVNGQKVMIPFIYKSTDNMMIQMLRQKDAPYSDAEGNILIFNEETRAILKTVAEHAESRAFSTFKISSYPGNFFNAGQCLFAVDSTAGATWMGSDAPLLDISADKVVPFETAVRAVPQFDPAHPQMISQGPSVCVFNKRDPQEVLASWLFTQYLLTNEVQIAYSETEGYLPVTSKAHESAEYRDYLSRTGEDNERYYDVKIEASKLLLENTDKTFTTPVFNGSTSLRNAAGQLIEETAKSVRRGEKADEEYLDELFKSVTSLYRLDQRSVTAADGASLGPLPGEARALLTVLGAAWCGIALYALGELLKNKREKR